jgi:hypothetical protein
LAPSSPPPPAVLGFLGWFLLAVTGLAAILALHNVRARRADVRGALLVGGFALVTHVVLVLGQPLPDELVAFGSRLFGGVSYALHTAVNVTVFYLALEPFARRHWPDSMISWSRLLNGRFRDPAVGREVLIGMFAPQAVFCVIALALLGLDAAGLLAWSSPPPAPTPGGLGGPLRPLAQVVHASGDIVFFGGLFLLFLLLLRALVRIAWLADGLWLALLLGLIYLFGREDPDTPGAIYSFAVVLSTFLVLLARVGFLSAVVCLFTYVLPFSTAMTLRPGDWYFSSSLVILVAFALLAVWAYKTSTAGRSVFESRTA